MTFDKITIKYFKDNYFVSFPRLIKEGTDTDHIISSSIDAVYIMFEGINDLLSSGYDPVKDREKVNLCYGLLVAWYIQDMYPQYAAQVQSMGGIPLSSKRIGPITITYRSNEKRDGNLFVLNSNAFGVKALAMIKTSSKIHSLFRG